MLHLSGVGFRNFVSNKINTMINSLKNIFGFGPKVDMKELIEKGALILDVRTKAEFKDGHVKGSVNVPLSQLETYVQKLKNKEQVIITCCASGMRSASARNYLQAEGFKHVYNGGGWMSLNRYA